MIHIMGYPQDWTLDYETGTWGSCFPPVEIVELNRDNFLVYDIVISSIDGPIGGDVTFLLLTKDINERRIGFGYKRIIVNDITVPSFGEPRSYPATVSMAFPLYMPGTNNRFLQFDKVEHISDLNVVRIGQKAIQ